MSKVAEELGVCWWTVMNAVVEHGTPLVDDPRRIGAVRHLGVDETSFLKATRTHPTIYATGLVDLERHVMIDLVEGNSAADPRGWTEHADARWLAGIRVVATDLAESFRVRVLELRPAAFVGVDPEERSLQASGAGQDGLA